ncbi:hypothetical protein D3C78_1852450 [compost metagenome]
MLLRYRHPVTIVTKGSLVLRDLDLLSELARQRLVAAIISLHGFALEVGTSELGGARLVLDCRQSLIVQT